MLIYFLCAVGLGGDRRMGLVVTRWCFMTSTRRVVARGILLNCRRSWLNSRWMLSPPCSPRIPRPTRHCLVNGTIWSSRQWSFGKTEESGNSVRYASMQVFTSLSGEESAKTAADFVNTLDKLIDKLNDYSPSWLISSAVNTFIVLYTLLHTENARRSLEYFTRIASAFGKKCRLQWCTPVLQHLSIFECFPPVGIIRTTHAHAYAN